ncbi:hypothetical protein BT96DRAFT_965595 [Gymnopus androsaceus JB14]|uniref:Protein kinase domain-containing protein n=1 Tax=Gymnopus androsaceus JB14 TaxID=1447944 RepID=A0A6A4HN70_9AGAR|nr:hypothetical protein BT96DRAFT_965595 [Gymnopus androsaceus JB14]
MDVDDDTDNLLAQALTRAPRPNEELEEFEEFWRDHYDWLKTCGYILRPRYRPGWVASWTGTDLYAPDCEDYEIPLFRYNLDAIRVLDGMAVMLRRPDPSSVSHELRIGQLLSSQDARTNPRNHCVPILETLQIPEVERHEPRNQIVVMPLLTRWDIPEFDTVGEVVDFCSQVFEGLQFMHSLNVAHNDSKDNNIMMDWFPIYEIPPHGVRTFYKSDWSGQLEPRRRTTHPVKYHFIDWNMSKQYDPAHGPPLQNPGYGGDQSVPEFKRREPCNPFKVDVYCLGNAIRGNFLVGNDVNPPRSNLEFLRDLISDMTCDDPSKRPIMDEVVSRFEEIRKGLRWWKLRSRVPSKKQSALAYILYSPIHWIRQFSYIVRRIPAIPDYTSACHSSTP